MPLYTRLQETYQKKKADLIMKHDIKSQTSYASHLIERGLLLDSLQPYYEIIDSTDDIVTVKDHRKKGKSFTVEIRQGKVYCEQDETGTCDHVGYILGSPYIIQKANEKGLKLSRAQS